MKFMLATATKGVTNTPPPVKNYPPLNLCLQQWCSPICFLHVRKYPRKNYYVKT